MVLEKELNSPKTEGFLPISYFKYILKTQSDILVMNESENYIFPNNMPSSTFKILDYEN